MSFLRRLPPLFYIGLLPVVVLLWAWADSLSYQGTWTYCRGDVRHRVSTRMSTISYRREAIDFRTGARAGTVIYPRTEALGKVSREALDPATPGRWFPLPTILEQEGPEIVSSRGYTFVSRSMRIPIYFILAAYLPLWLGPAWWQARRRRKKLEPRMNTDGHE